MKDNEWAQRVEQSLHEFADEYSVIYSKSKRELYAFFEIGCFLSLVRFYEKSGCKGHPQNLKQGGYRYLTTPNGNPANFSYILMNSRHEQFEIRQQVRVRSHLDPDIAFTPDIVVIPSLLLLKSEKNEDYASGSRKFFYVDSDSVIAAHECKSLNPFPELFISFLGILFAGHKWISQNDNMGILDKTGIHLAPTLFVGGTARSLHKKMVQALMRVYPLNIILGMHSGTWNLSHNELRKIDNPIAGRQVVPDEDLPF